MERRNFAGTKAIGKLITLTSFLIGLALLIGATLIIIGIAGKNTFIWGGIGMICSTITLLIIKALLRGLESIVMASDTYIDHMQNTKSVQEEIDEILNS